jgi:hypothetical protein
MKRTLNDWFESYLEYTKNSECPTIYHKWTAISTIASALMRKTWFIWDNQTYPNLYIILVGPPACRKGTALWFSRTVTKNLDDIKLTSDAVTPQAFIESFIDAEVSTPLSNGDILTHSSLTVHSPELAVFLGTENKQLINYLTDWFDSPDEWSYRTRGQGTETIRNVYVNLLGATTPSSLQDTIITSAIGGGLTSRMIFVFASKKGKPVPFPWQTEKERKLRENLHNDLGAIKCLNGQFKFTEDFMDIYADWYYTNESDRTFEDNRFDGYFQRKPKHLLKIASILSASRGNSMEISGGDFKKAIKLIKEIEPNMPMTFSGIGTMDTTYIISLIRMELSSGNTATVNSLLRKYYRDADEDLIKRAIITMVSMGEVIRTPLKDENGKMTDIQISLTKEK